MLNLEEKERGITKKILATALLIIIIVSTLGVAVTAGNAKEKSDRGFGWKTGSKMKDGTLVPFQRSWVRMNGVVEAWGSEDVNGSLSINTRTIASDEDVRGYSLVTAIWSNTTNFREKGNFSYSFYSAKLVEANISTLNHEDADFFLNGTWNIVNVTISQTLIKTGDTENGYTIDRQTKTEVHPIITKAYGELKVTDNWTNFELSITGTDDLNGKVTRTRMTQMTFNKFKIGEDDSDKVNKLDLKAFENNYGASPGWGNYDSNMDFNGNYKIDIADLSTVAAKVDST